MMNMDAFTANYYLLTNLPDSQKNYYRAQMTTTESMDDVSADAITNLVSDGDALWD